MIYRPSKNSNDKNKKKKSRKIKKRYSNENFSLKNTKSASRKSDFELYENKSELFIDFKLLIKKSDIYSVD